MGLLKDFYLNNLTIRKRYWLRELLSLRNWRHAFQWRHQRAERGWSYQDTWGGGEHIAAVCAGVLYALGEEKNIVDWDAYFEMNYYETWGYKSLHEVADDLILYVEWDTMQFHEPLYSELRDEDRWAMDFQVYEQAKNAMHFVADNLGGLWW